MDQAPGGPKKKGSLELFPILAPVQAAARDPVCGMTMDPATAAASYAYEGQTYYFCCPSCRQKFVADPERYLHPPDAATAPTLPEQAQPGQVYICPMDPEVVSDRPGSCPKCGMALEPRLATADEGPNPELVDMGRRFWVSLALSVPILVLAMGGMGSGSPLHHLGSLTNWIQLLLATPVVLWCGWPFFTRAWTSVLQRSPNMFTLIALGVGSAYLYSVLATLAPGMVPAGFGMAGGVVHVYFESAAAIVVLVLLGQVLEIRARSQT